MGKSSKKWRVIFLEIPRLFVNGGSFFCSGVQSWKKNGDFPAIFDYLRDPFGYMGRFSLSRTPLVWTVFCWIGEFSSGIPTGSQRTT
jgi:hypothetical protein